MGGEGVVMFLNALVVRLFTALVSGAEELKILGRHRRDRQRPIAGGGAGERMMVRREEKGAGGGQGGGN